MPFHVPYVFLVTIDETERSSVLDESHLGLWAVVLFGHFISFTPSEEEAHAFLRIAKQRNRGATAACA
jgi:hypothetical protein